MTGGYPMIGVVRRNGDRLYGFQSKPALELAMGGTPKVGSLIPKSVTVLVGEIRIGDALPVRWLGDRWTVYRENVPVGDVHWPVAQHDQVNRVVGFPLYAIDSGVLHVEKVVVSTDGRVVNLAGYVQPA